MPHVKGIGETMNLSDFVTAHAPQLQCIPQVFWPTLHKKLAKEVFDAGESFKITGVEDEDTGVVSWKVVTDREIETDNPQNIYLIDHAWTYRVTDARTQLQQIPGLMDRMAALMEIDTDDKEQEAVIESILERMWRYNQTYQFGHFQMGSEESVPFWYIMDEFGSRIQHADSPTFKTAPFFYIPLQLTFTLLWPLENVAEGDEVTRNYVENNYDSETRKARLLPWKPTDLKHIHFKQTEPDTSYFQSYKMEENLPDPDAPLPELPKDRNIKIYINYRGFTENLTDPRFEVVDNIEEADIIWTTQHWKDFRKLSTEMPNKFINQFPNECVFTVKDLLAIVSRRAGKSTDDVTVEPTPKWLPVTYNLQTELPKFVSYFQNREEKGLDNHWICKPWNLARGMDMHITNNIEHIVRLPDSGPKIACKYIEDPVLFYREEIGNVKFDIRYIVLLSSVKPLKLYAYKVFWLRFANRPFSLDHFEEYEKHFTVMNYYAEGVKLKQVHYDEYIPMFESQYPAYNWKDVEENIFDMFRELFTAAASKPSPHGVHPSPQSRGMYAIDLLLKWSTDDKGEKTMQPVICEVNFAPDCDRACVYHPFFVNDVLSTLFLDDVEGRLVTLL